MMRNVGREVKELSMGREVQELGRQALELRRMGLKWESLEVLKKYEQYLTIGRLTLELKRHENRVGILKIE